MQLKLTAADGTKLLTKADIARITQQSLGSVDYWIKTGALPYVKLGRNVRFFAMDLVQFFENRRIGKLFTKARVNKLIRETELLRETLAPKDGEPTATARKVKTP